MSSELNPPLLLTRQYGKDVCFKSKAPPPFSCLKALTEESLQKKEKAEKGLFLFTAQKLEKWSKFRFSASPDLGLSLTKTKNNNYGRGTLSGVGYVVELDIWYQTKTKLGTLKIKHYVCR
jgi:hypothetical protein